MHSTGTPVDLEPAEPETSRPSILLVEPESVALDGLMKVLQLEGYPVEGAVDGEEALRKAAAEPPQLVVTSLRLPGLSGLDLIGGLRRQGVDAPVVVLSALPSVDQAVTAMRRGAEDYLPKPVDIGRLLDRLEGLAGASSAQTGGALADVAGRPLIGTSRVMRRLVESIRTAADSSATVLIQGETGTGKELFARLVHSASARARGAFLPLHCASLAEGILESELFGHERGAFTGAVKQRQGRFELADGGTLFLDEVGEMGPAVQVKLLRVLEDGSFERVGGTRTLTVDVRMVSATNRDLAEEVEAGRFREDLYYRLNVIPLRLPPLRERPEDIPLLARAFLTRYSAKYGRRLLGFTPEAIEALAGYPWPGNVRELDSVVERAVVFARGHRVEPSALPAAIQAAAGPAVTESVALPVGLPLKEMEKRFILRTLASCDNNRSRAARVLGISDRKIRYKLKEWGQP